MMGLAKEFDEFMLTFISSKVAKDAIRGISEFGRRHSLGPKPPQ